MTSIAHDQCTDIYPRTYISILTQEQGSSFGITKENFNEACLIPIEGFLNKAAEDNTRVKRELQVKQEALAAEEAALASMPDDVMVNMQIGEYVFDVAWNSKRTCLC